MARIIQFFDGAQSETTPTIGNIIASGIITYPDDATYEANEQGSPAAGNIYMNTTLDLLRYYTGSDWISIVDEESLQTIINKTIDADNNTITNLEDDNIKAGAAIDVTKLHDGSVDNTEFSHLNGVTSAIQTQLDNKQETSEKGAANGYASLDGTGKVPLSEIPDKFASIEGNWNASTNTPTLADGVGNLGEIYVVDTAGTQDLGSGSQTFNIGDWVVYNSSNEWIKTINSTAVTSVNGDTGAVVLDLDDINDVDASTPNDTEVLTYNNGTGNWEAQPAAGGATVLDDLTDVDTTTTAPVTGDLLEFDGTNWAPAKNRFQEKLLPSDVNVDGEMTALTFNNLVIGLEYELRGQLFFELDSGGGTDPDVEVRFWDGLIGSGTVLGYSRMRIQETTDSVSDLIHQSFNLVFTATTTVVRFELFSSSASGGLRGNGTKQETYIQLEERKNITVVTDFT